MAVPPMNNDIISVTLDRKTGRYKVAAIDRIALLRIVDDLQRIIDNEMGARDSGPLRFVIPLAMRFTEQAGRISFRKPKGKNPYNIMGTGVDRPDNKEEENGRMVNRPASFQEFDTEAQGVATFFRALRTWHDGAWKGAWEAIRDASSFEDFARGLRPEGRPHYLTRNIRAHVRGLRGRGLGAIRLLELIYRDELERIRGDSADDEILFPALLGDPYFGPDVRQRLKKSRQAARRAEKMLRRLAHTHAKHFSEQSAVAPY